MCIPPILVETTLERGVISLIRKTLEPCNWRLIIWRGSCATNGEGELPLILTSLLTMRRMVVIDPDQGLLLVSLSRMMRTTTMSAETGTHLLKAWETMWWAKRSTKSPYHHSRAELREGDFLGSSLSPCSPCTMVEWTLWNMWATSTKEWLCTPRMRPWCARCSLLV